MLRRLCIAALAVYLLALLGAALTPRPTRAQAQSPPAPQPTQPARLAGPEAPLVGFALNLHHTDDVRVYLAAVDRLAAMGFNSVEVLTPAFQTDGASEEVRVLAGPGRGPQRQDLVRLLTYAKAMGLRTKLMPIVLFTKPRGNEWRGKISPEQWDPWWASYRRTIESFAAVADQTGVEVFSVGSELLSTERSTEQWETLIAGVRTRFRGKLSYSTNWDHYHVPTFWSKLDVIGINGYWNLAKDAGTDTPSDEQLLDRWRKIRTDVLAFARTQDRPVLFTEIGYPSLPWGLKDPWNYINSKKLPSAPDVQARGYRAFLGAWVDAFDPRAAERPPVAGVFFYEWDVYRHGDETDTGYGVRGKPAEALLEEWLKAEAGDAETRGRPDAGKE